MNQAGKELIGIPQDTPSTSFVEDFFPRLQADLMNQTRTDDIVHQETIIKTASGAEIPVMVSFLTYGEDLRTLPIVGESPQQYVAVFARELRAEIEFREQLCQDRRRAEEAASAKSDFLATMSHEIRTPLHGIIGSADLLQCSELDSWQQDKIANIQNCSSALLTIINDILDYSKIDARKVELEKSTCLVSDCLDSCVSVVSAELRRKKLNLQYHICRNSIKEAIADASKVRQIILVCNPERTHFNSQSKLIPVHLCF